MKPYENGVKSLGLDTLASSRNGKNVLVTPGPGMKCLSPSKGSSSICASDQEGNTMDILVRRRRNKRAAERFFRRLVKGQGREPRSLVTDKLKDL